MPALILDLSQKAIEMPHGAIGQVMQHQHYRFTCCAQHRMRRGGPAIGVAEIAWHGIPQHHGRLRRHQMPRCRTIQQVCAQGTAAAIRAEIALGRGKIPQQNISFRDFMQSLGSTAPAERRAMRQRVIANHMPGIARLRRQGASQGASRGAGLVCPAQPGR